MFQLWLITHVKSHQQLCSSVEMIGPSDHILKSKCFQSPLHVRRPFSSLSNRFSDRSRLKLVIGHCRFHWHDIWPILSLPIQIKKSKVGLKT